MIQHYVTEAQFAELCKLTDNLHKASKALMDIKEKHRKKGCNLNLQQKVELYRAYQADIDKARDACNAYDASIGIYN